jgi:tetratricopeptide (TPR) repeat protein
MKMGRILLRICIGVSFFLGCAALLLRPTHAGSHPDAGKRDYSELVRQSYDYPFGKDKPFLPSNAETTNGQFIPAGEFPTAEYCGHCHKEAYHEWRQSLHANSFREPFYKKNVDLLMTTQGIPEARHCEGCHNPIALLSGAMTEHPVDKDRSFDKDGITCSVCHSIQKLQPSFGLASYVMGTPAVIVDANGKPIPGEVPYQEIMEHTDRHVAAVMKDFYRTPEYCGTCHKANLPDTLNNYKWLRAIGLYDEWQNSSFSHRSPLPFYSKPNLSCQNCHMGREKAALLDYGAKNGMLASHRWIGGNTATAWFYKDEDQLQRTIQFLRDDRLVVDLFAIRRNGETQWTGPLGTNSFRIAPNDNVEVAVVIQNKGIGHSLLPEQRDIFESWVEFVVKDARGHTIMHSGGLQRDGYLDPDAHTFVTRMLDDKGDYLTRHEVWLRHTIADDATIQSGRSTIARYEFHVPAAVKGPLTVTASVDYRHFNEAFTRFVLGNKHKPLPVTVMASRTRTFAVGENLPTAPLPGDNPDWMRWNNFGIGLIDALQYGEAVDAFEHVAALRPDYAEAYANIGIAYYLWEKYPQAAASFQESLARSPNSARTLYWQALVDRNLANLPAAIADLEKVVQLYPMSIDAHRELGFSYYQLHKYDLAAAQYQAVQGIDPDDLAAHYILSIVYRRLGMREKAATEAALFANEKNDPMADVVTLKFLAKHPNLSMEAVPWHVHTEAEEAPTARPGSPRTGLRSWGDMP